MLKKLRWRFVGAAMAAFAIVVIGLLVLVDLANLRSVTDQLDQTLASLQDVALQEGPPPDQDQDQELPTDRVPPPIGLDKFSPEFRYTVRFFTVTLDSRGAPVSQDRDFIASVSHEQAETFAVRAKATGRDHGWMDGYRYLLLENEDGSTTCLFLNAEREQSSLRSLLLVSCAAAAGSLAVVFLLVVVFSKRAIAPYVRNIETQKRFITDAGHELKTPLTSISASADILALEHEGDEWVQNIQAQSARLAKLIADLVTLSRLDEEKPFPERAAFSLSDTVWEVSEPFTALARAKGKTYEQQIEDGIELTGDRESVAQMVSLLLDNAVRYADPGGTIRLALRRSHRRVELEVFDTCTIDEGVDLSRLFDRFYRPDASHSTHTGGTGIGLSIVKATVEAHGGTIRAIRRRDEPGRPGGLSFLVRL